MKAIQTKFLPCTNFKGSRIKAFDLDGNQTTLPYEHGINSEDNHRCAAKALCIKMNWVGELIGGGIKGGMVWVFKEQ